MLVVILTMLRRVRDWRVNGHRFLGSLFNTRSQVKYPITCNDGDTAGTTTCAPVMMSTKPSNAAGQSGSSMGAQ